jgi:TonB family protein
MIDGPVLRVDRGEPGQVFTESTDDGRFWRVLPIFLTILSRSMRLMIRAALLAAIALCALAPAARAQQNAERCAPVPDSVAGPNDWQVRERAQLREQLATVLRSHGAPPRGLLFVDVDSSRTGVVRFLDAGLPDSTIQAATDVVSEYLRSLERGRAYQALIRVDGEYPLVVPGRMRCRPQLESVQLMLDSTTAVAERHPLAGKVTRNVGKHADLLLVVNRDGGVSWVQVLQPTGDEYLDPHVQRIAYQLQFLPVTLDGTPIDSRMRFRLTFTIR